MRLMVKLVTLVVTLVLLQLTFLPKADAATMSLARCQQLKVICIWDKDNYSGDVWTFSGIGCTNVAPSFNDRANSAAMYFEYGNPIRWRLITYLHSNCQTQRDIVTDDGRRNLDYKNQASSFKVERY
jgi:hypothetical protein